MIELPDDEPPGPGAPLDVLEALFSSLDWTFERDGDDEIVATVRGGWSVYELRALWREDERVLQVLADTGLKVDRAAVLPATAAALFEILALVNEQLWLGHFEWWSSDGGVLFRHTVLLDPDEEPRLTLEQARALVEAAIDECDRHYPAFQFVVWGGKSPCDALRDAMVDTLGEA